MTPFSTASSALPPAPSMVQAPAFAAIPASQVESTIGFVTKFLGMKPDNVKLEIPTPPKLINLRRSILMQRLCY